MKCMICHSPMSFYFQKKFKEFGLKKVDYFKCSSCGFTAAKTLFDLNNQQWSDLNEKFHSSYHFTDKCNYDANWIKRLNIQAKTLALLKKENLLQQKSPWLDYGCGDGKLSLFLSECGVSLLNYDKYTGGHTTNVISNQELYSHKYDLVVSTSVFEHVRSIDNLDEMEQLVSKDGCFVIHTFANENIPQDPNWFYLLPVHCSFYSNKSMQLLFDKWGYNFSIYHLPSRMWFWYKKMPKQADKIIDKLNKKYLEKEFFYKSTFVDYWK